MASFPEIDTEEDTEDNNTPSSPMSMAVCMAHSLWGAQYVLKAKKTLEILSISGHV